jgi:hypothetical protein
VGNEFVAEAISDIDGNTTNNEWAYMKPVPGATTVGTAFSLTTLCVNTGVYNPNGGGQDLLETVGPCDSFSGNSQF